MSASLIDLTGKTFGMLTVLRVGGKDNDRAYRWVCECDCGNVMEIRGVSLRATNGTKSCGCMIAISNKRTKTTHGHSRSADRGACSPSYYSWSSMRSRCTNENDSYYHRYGGRGIKVCERWERFENFLSDMGERPAGLTLDRVNNDGNYEPGNCRWATRAEQHSNRHDNRRLSYGGKTLIIAEWSRLSGTRQQTITWRTNKGWPAGEAIFGRGVHQGR